VSDEVIDLFATNSLTEANEPRRIALSVMTEKMRSTWRGSREARWSH
jgi:hypothetical protein